MASIADTVEVPASTYSNALPEDFNSDTVEIGISAFSDKVYLKFPRFDRSGTNDMCMSAQDIFQATIRVTYRNELEVKPVLRRMMVLRKREDQYAVGDATDVSTTVIGDMTTAKEAHLKLVEEFCTTISGFQDDAYWKGYKKGLNISGDEHYKWDDIAWKCFKRKWDGNVELLAEVGRWFAREGIAVCSKSKAFFPAPEWTTPTGSYVATMSDVYEGVCPNCGADKAKHWECIKSPASVRKPMVYKCKKCGAQRKGITTG